MRSGFYYAHWEGGQSDVIRFDAEMNEVATLTNGTFALPHFEALEARKTVFVLSKVPPFQEDTAQPEGKGNIIMDKRKAH
jgi:hypothetical protein